MKRTIRLAAVGALAAAALALSPAAANGALTLAPSSMTFSQPVGTTSASQTATLTLTCTAPCGVEFFNTSIATTPAVFTQTNNCGSSLFAFFIEPIDSCTINVAFAANTAGNVNGTLSTGMGGPTASLTGTGVAAPTTPAAGGVAGKAKCKRKGKKRASSAKKKCKKKRGG